MSESSRADRRFSVYEMNGEEDLHADGDRHLRNREPMVASYIYIYVFYLCVHIIYILIFYVY